MVDSKGLIQTPVETPNLCTSVKPSFGLLLQFDHLSDYFLATRTARALVRFLS